MTIDRLCQILLEQIRLDVISSEIVVEQLQTYYEKTKDEKLYLKQLKEQERK
jgi:hypothetical protein